jgi:hypothetical protein
MASIYQAGYAVSRTRAAPSGMHPAPLSGKEAAMKAIAIVILCAALPAAAQVVPGETKEVVPPNSPASPTSPGAIIQGPEVKEAAKGELKATFKTIDRDRDGAISRREAESEPELAQLFDRLDTDGDGRLTPAEFSRFEKRD